MIKKKKDLQDFLRNEKLIFEVEERYNLSVEIKEIIFKSLIKYIKSLFIEKIK